MSPEALAYRYRVMEVFLKSGTHPERISDFRPLLERGGVSLGSESSLKLYIPKIEAEEKDRLRLEMRDQFVSSQFDGTTRLGEAINLVNRWCTPGFELVQRLTIFRTTLKHLNNQQLSALVGQHILRDMLIPLETHVAFVRDSCSTNGAAVRRLSNIFTSSSDILCLCHTLCHMGEHMSWKIIHEFMRHWIGLVYSHAGAKWLLGKS